MEFIYSKRWCELLFENRNKNYGAYQIRMREADNIVAAWFITALFFSLAIGVAIWSGGNTSTIFNKPLPVIPDKTEFTFTKIILPPLPKIETPKTNKAKQTKRITYKYYNIS